MPTWTRRRVETPARGLSPGLRARRKNTRAARWSGIARVGMNWIVAQPSVAGRHLGRRADPAVRQADRVDERAADHVPARVGDAEAADERRAGVEPRGHELDVGDDQPLRQRDLRRPGSRPARRSLSRRPAAAATPSGPRSPCRAELVRRGDGHAQRVADVRGAEAVGLPDAERRRSLFPPVAAQPLDRRTWSGLFVHEPGLAVSVCSSRGDPGDHREPPCSPAAARAVRRQRSAPDVAFAVADRVLRPDLDPHRRTDVGGDELVRRRSSADVLAVAAGGVAAPPLVAERRSGCSPMCRCSPSASRRPSPCRRSSASTCSPGPAPLATTPVAAETAFAEPSEFDAVTETRSVCADVAAPHLVGLLGRTGDVAAAVAVRVAALPAVRER